MRQQDFFAGHPEALAVFEKVRAVLDKVVPFEVRTTKSQVALRRRRGFAYIWIPGRYLRKPAAEVVLSIALGRHDDSPRFKQVAHPAPESGCTTWRYTTSPTSTNRSARGCGRRLTAPADHEVRAPSVPLVGVGRSDRTGDINPGDPVQGLRGGAARPGAGNGATAAVH